MASREQRDPIDVAARALRRRDRSRHDVEQRLEQAGVDGPARADALETLERIGYVDDGRFARSRASALAERGYGDEAIRADLRAQGIEGEAARAALDALAPEVDRAVAVVARQGGGPRIAARLLRHGFDPDVVEQAMAAHGAEADGGV